MYIYLDNNATTPCDPRVVEAMLPYFTEQPGNAASRSHAFGWMAEEAVNKARQQLATALEADPKEIIFTSGATEAINLAIKGVFESYVAKGNHVVTLKTEHKAVLDTCAWVEKRGGAVTYLDVSGDGLVDLQQLREAIRPQTILVSMMWANNETGVIQPMQEIGAICKEQNILLMSDATQAVGKLPVHPRAVGIDLLACSAHKLYGPKGIGALYVSRREPRVKMTAQIDGGGHQQGLRSGTLNVPGIVGFGNAVDIARLEMQTESDRLRELRDHLEKSLLERIVACRVNGHREQRLPHVSNLTFLHTDAEQLMMTFNQRIAVSSGSACTSAALYPSHVLIAMGLTEEEAYASLRFSLGRFTTAEQIEEVIEAVVKGVKMNREQSPAWELFIQERQFKKENI